MNPSVNASSKPRTAPSKRLRKKRLDSVLAKLAAGAELSLYESAVAALLTRGEVSLREVAEGSKVPRRTIEKIASGHTTDPLASNCEKLATYFRCRKRDSDKSLVRA